jgi:hypothetical protein
VGLPLHYNLRIAGLTNACFALGSGNGALMSSIFGGDVKDLRVWLAEGRFSDGWEPKNREALGHTIAQAQITSLAIEFNIDEKQKLRTGDTTYPKPNGA